MAVALHSGSEFALCHYYYSTEMNSSRAPVAIFTNSGAPDAFLMYHQNLREIGKYIDLEIEVSYCSYEWVIIYAQTAEGNRIRAHRWVMEARFPGLRNVFYDNYRTQRLDLGHFSTVSVARLYFQRAIANAIAFSLNWCVLLTGQWRLSSTTPTRHNWKSRRIRHRESSC